jgi:aminopeptidase N
MSRAATLRGGATAATVAALMSSSAVAQSAEAQATSQAAPKEKYRKDYKAPHRTITDVELDFQLHAGAPTVVNAKLIISPPSGQESGADLLLDGEDLTLKSVAIDGKSLTEDVDYKFTSDGMVLLASAMPEQQFELTSTVEVMPESNTQLSGLYKSGAVFCTQCEAEGFRRITYFQDRPDVMAKYKVRVEAAESSFPILLSNGNRLEEGSVGTGTGRHYAVWQDPFPKPSYLFALVAGDLGSIKSSFKVRHSIAYHFHNEGCLVIAVAVLCITVTV